MLNPYEGGKFRISSVYGERLLNGRREFHSGLDLVGESSKNLLAISDGTVIQSRMVTDRSDLTWQWGNYITVKADTGELVIYCHLSKRLVSKGQRVKKGDVIGIEGNTGYSFGSHCHLEIRNSDNKVSDTVNTVKFTGIPNAIGIYTVIEEDEMTTEEKKEIEALKQKVSDLEKALAGKESAERVWHYWDEIKKEAPWAYEPLLALYKKGLFKGESAGNLMLSQTKLETLVIMARGFRALGVIDYAE